MRRKGKAFIDGEFNLCLASGDLFAFTRISEDAMAYIAVNRGENPATVTLLPEFEGKTRTFGTEIQNGVLNLPPYGYSVVIK